MKKRFFLLLLLCALLMLPALAQAETLQKIPVERMSFQTIEGLVYENKAVDGYAHLLIDSSATDWQKVMLHSGAANELRLSCWVTRPEWATMGASITGNVWQNDEEIIRELQYASMGDWSMGGCARDIAVYTKEKEILSPVETNGGMNPFIHAIHWSDGQGRDLYEVMEINFEHTSMAGRRVSIFKLDKDLIQPNTNRVPGVTSDVNDGEVVYTFDSTQIDLSTQSYISTALEAPEGAKRLRLCDEYGGWMECDVINGAAEFAASLDDWQTGDFITGITTFRKTVLWMDENNRVMKEGGIFAYTLINEKSNMPWMYYVEQDIENGVIENAIPWKAAKISDANVLIGYEEDDRLHDVFYFDKQIDPETAHVHISLKDDLDVTVSMAQEMSWCNVTYELDPPEGACYVSTNRNTRNNFYGRKPDAYEDQLNRLLRANRMALEPGLPVQKINSMFRRLNTPIENVSLFSTWLETEPDFGGAYLFCWFDANGNPMEINYIAETADRILLEPDSMTVSSEAEIKHPVKGPVFIDGKNTGWKLRSEYHVQEGSHAYIVELYLEDKHGNIIHDFGSDSMVFYLPYREHDDFGKYDFYLMHYEGGNFGDGRPVTVTPTKNGIRFEVSSLSPFVVSWETDAVLHEEPLFLTEWLWEMGYTPELVEEEMLGELSEVMPEFDGMKLFCAELLMDGEEVDPDPDKLYYLSYPEGTSAQSCTFEVFHMTDWGPDAGRIERLACFPDENGIGCRFDSLSPVLIAWKNLSPAEIPVTGDATPLGWLMCLMTVSGMMILRARKRRRA